MKSKNIDIIEEHSEPIEVITPQSLSLEELSKELAKLTAYHRKAVIKAAKQIARAYASIERIHQLMDAEQKIREAEEGLSND